MPGHPSASPSSSGRPGASNGRRDGSPTGADDDLLVVGRVLGAYGVLGWLRVLSHCSPPDNLLRYAPWYLQDREGWRRVEPVEGRAHGGGVVVRLEACEDREAAQALAGTAVAVRRSQLPGLEAGEFYWADLIGLEVVGARGECLGVVEGLIETGANDVLVVKGERERLIPYLPGRVVLEVDLTARRMRVDWDPDF